MGQATDRHRVVRISTGAVGGDAGPPASVRHARPDTLVAEEPMELRLGRAGVPHPPLTVTMRTPGDDLDLAIGFLFTEGMVHTADDVADARVCTGRPPYAGNVVDVTLAAHTPGPSPTGRAFPTTSACGVCGKSSIEAVRTRSRYPVDDDGTSVPAEVLADLPERLRAGQRVFARTGGLHAAGLFTAGGTPVAVREDVGRHNALDKLIGWALRERRVPLRGHVLLVSGRASFELVQKAWMAGLPVLAAVSAPSTLAVSLAAEAGMTLIGFLRAGAMNVYTRADRVR